MEIRIDICDDCLEQLELVKSFIHKYRKINEINIHTETDPVLFLSEFRVRKPHIVFLDIDMEGMNGITLGERIRVINDDTVIVYITGHDDYALEAFGVKAYHYLLKPVSEKKFMTVLEDAIKIAEMLKLQKLKKGKFTFKRRNEIVNIEFDHICYFEKVGRKIKVRTDTDAIEYYGKFIELIEQLDQSYFIQCHQGFIINKEKIATYKGGALNMTSCERVPVSRTHQKKVKEMIEDLLFNEVDI